MTVHDSQIGTRHESRPVTPEPPHSRRRARAVSVLSSSSRDDATVRSRVKSVRASIVFPRVDHRRARVLVSRIARETARWTPTSRARRAGDARRATRGDHGGGAPRALRRSMAHPARRAARLRRRAAFRGDGHAGPAARRARRRAGLREPAACRAGRGGARVTINLSDSESAAQGSPGLAGDTSQRYAGVEAPHTASRAKLERRASA